jgi:selenocysteine lyase/cysteine desulfurase
VFLLVDGVQSSGILAHDLSSEPVDGWVTSTSKGLLGLYGFGFLYISPNWIDRLEPAYLSRPAVLMQSDDHSTMGQHDYALQPDSRRFELGSYNIAGAYAADASLQLLLDLGIKAIEERVLPLARALNEGVAALGLAPGVPSDGPAQSHIVTFGALDAGGHGFSSNPMIGPVSDHLEKAKVAHTIRRGQLRFAVHAFNNEDDIERAVACVGEAIKSL